MKDAILGFFVFVALVLAIFFVVALVSFLDS